MKKPRMRRFGIGTGTKVQQANLRKLAKSMADNPKMLIPKCESECSKCAFEKVLVKLQKINSMKSNSNALNKLAKSGKQFERGYASMLVLASEQEQIMFAIAKLPSGDVSYTMRGKVNKEILIGFQHFDEPTLRLLAYSEIALKKGIHLYSSADEITCTGKNPSYPPALLAEILRTTGYSLRKNQGNFQCEHMAEHEGQSLNIEIKSLGQSIQLCKYCTSRKANLYNELTGRVLAKNPGSDFDITLEHDLKCSADTCSISNAKMNTSELLSQYKMGAISDKELLDKYSQMVRDSLAGLGKPIFVLGNTCYEDDYQAFIKALNPSEIEEIALNRVLKAAPEPIVLDTATPNAVLTLFWDKIGASAIYAVIGDKELAKKIYQDSKNSGKTPAQILRDAKIQAKSKSVLDSLPDLRGLGKMGKHVDEVARTYKAMGKEETVRLIDRVTSKETKMKSINCGFLKALDSIKGKEWQFSKEELDYGNYLKEFAKALLDSKPDNYKEAVKNLLTASGSGESVS